MIKGIVIEFDIVNDTLIETTTFESSSEAESIFLKKINSATPDLANDPSIDIEAILDDGWFKTENRWIGLNWF